MSIYPEIVWDDEFQGKRWRYGLTYRPVGYGNVPKGYIIHSNRAHPDFQHGTIDYPFPLPERQAELAGLTAVPL